jgi:ABC-type antimicrobial peptide transport system permease subunit
MALGAKTWDVVRLVLAATSASVGTGLAAGLALSLTFDKVARQWLTESSRDPLTLAGLAVLLLFIAALACWAPARRAAAVHPSEALRYE